MAVAVLGADPDRCYRHLHRFFTRLYRLAANQRPLVARLDGRIVASTNDLVGGACRARPIDKLRSVPALALTGPRAAIRAARWFDDWEHRDPDRPHAHFGPFGVEPELQGRGIGSIFLREYTRRLDEAGEASYLETEKPQNVALYQRFGFEVIEEAEVLATPNWFMWREAGAGGPALARLICAGPEDRVRRCESTRLVESLTVGELLDDLARGLGIDVRELQIEADRVLDVAEQRCLLDLGRRLRRVPRAGPSGRHAGEPLADPLGRGDVAVHARAAWARSRAPARRAAAGAGRRGRGRG